MTPDQALAIATEMEAIGKRTQLLSTGEALVTLAAEVRRLRGIVAALCDDVEHMCRPNTRAGINTGSRCGKNGIALTTCQRPTGISI